MPKEETVKHRVAPLTVYGNEGKIWMGYQGRLTIRIETETSMTYVDIGLTHVVNQLEWDQVAIGSLRANEAHLLVAWGWLRKTDKVIVSHGVTYNVYEPIWEDA